MNQNIIMIDTCIWIDLAEKPSLRPLALALKQLIDSNEVKVISTPIIKEEFQNNRDKFIKKGRKNISQNIFNLKNLIKEHSTEDNREDILKGLDELNHKLPTMVDTVLEHSNLINEILESTEEIEVVDAIKLISAQKAYLKEAPFHNGKNNMADSMIIEIFFSQIDDTNTFYFISRNTNEYSQKGNINNPNEGFNEYFSKDNVHYSLDLYKTINEISPDTLEEIEFEDFWFEEGRGLFEILEQINKYEDIIWYNRHSYRAQQVEDGIIKIVDESEYDVYNHNQIVSHIWEGALKSAADKEKIYGEELLPESDFDFGMINGKLSALRWVLGDEWDMLDT